MTRIGIIAAIACVALPQAASAAGDPVFGGKLFLQCRACHTPGPGERNGIGPNLNGVVGAKSAVRPGYVYSPAMKKAGVTWTAANLDNFLTRPSAVVPGTKMAFGGIANPTNRAAVIAYLTTLKPPAR
ncbi:cytochrome c family protein [Sphingomonas sp. 4RDLI-65]|uniref:c-type cytochrome n=1 Tax=Sphingomonas sp. 4RDLI-65 TaxID=3111641 RepID=UPI003C1C3ADC